MQTLTLEFRELVTSYYDMHDICLFEKTKLQYDVLFRRRILQVQLPRPNASRTAPFLHCPERNGLQSEAVVSLIPIIPQRDALRILSLVSRIFEPVISIHRFVVEMLQGR